MSYSNFPKVRIGHVDNLTVTKSYVDHNNNVLSLYTLNDIFEYFGIEKIENHLRKLKIVKIDGKIKNK